MYPSGDLPIPDPRLDLVLTQAPAVSPLDLEDVRAHLKVDFTDDDAQIEGYMAAVVGWVDGYQGCLGRCLIEQQWCWYLERFPRFGEAFPFFGPRRELKLPLSPLIAVDSITYNDPSGAPQALDVTPAGGNVVIRTGSRAEIAPKRGFEWPQTDDNPRSVAITFRAGYAAKPAGANAGPDPADVPANIIAAMKLMVGDLYENRQAVLVAESRVTQILNPTADRLLMNSRASWF